MAAKKIDKAHLDEIIKCGKDPNYFFKKYIKIQHPIRGLIPFGIFPFQEDCVEEFNKHRFNIVVKSRQLGLSTLVAAYSVWMTIFQREKNILIIATKLKVAQNFIVKCKSMIKSLPDWLLVPEIVGDNKQEILFSHGSQIKAIPTSDDAGRSEALSLLIVDEAAFVRNFDTLWAGLYPTISTGGRVILISSPNGVGGQYHKLYVDALSNVNEFNAITLPWTVHPERDDEWFHKTTANLDTKQIAQEFLCDFSASGDTFLDAATIEKIRSSVRAPLEKIDKDLWIWEKPDPERTYVISADVARGDALDFSSFHVVDIDTSTVVAEYMGKIRPDMFGDMLIDIAKQYNQAVVCPENNTYGHATICRMIEKGYTRIYQQGKNTFDKSLGLTVYHSQILPEKSGYNMNGKTRDIAIGKLESSLRRGKIKTFSSRFYEQIKVFSWREGKAQAKSGYNDDLVLCLAIATQLYDLDGSYTEIKKNTNDALFESMSVRSRQLEEKSGAIFAPFGVYTSNSFNETDYATQKIGSGMMLPRGLKWIY